MARISTPEVDIAVGMGSTWGTARDLTAANVGRLIHASQFEWTAAFDEYQPRDIGFDNFITSVERLGLQCGISFTCDLSYDGAWLQIFAAFLGTASAPAEQTVSQGDYLHNLDLASNINGKYVTLVAKVEDDYVVELPSVKITSVSIQSNNNGVGTFTCQGIADRVVLNGAPTTNTVAEVNALSYPTFKPVVLGSTNHYLRMNSQSGGALSGSNDLNILSYSLTMTRPFQTRFELRGANSKYTREPLQLSPTTGTFSFQLSEIDDSIVDGLLDWSNMTEKKAELFMDGDPIASGVNRSIKLQFPRLAPAPARPDGYGVPNNASLMQPTLSYTMLQASAAPTGMTGVTNYIRAACINTRTVNYFN